MKGELHGMLTIRPIPILESNGTISQWKIPIIATEPIDVDNLKVEFSETLRDLTGTIEVVDGKPMILVTAPEVCLGPAGILGEIHVSEPHLNLTVSARANFVKRHSIRISPLAVSFTKRNPDDHFYTANILVQAVAQVSEEGEKQKNVVETIECTSPDHSLEVTTTRINDRLHRVILRVPEEELNQENDEFPIHWKVRSTAGNREAIGSGSVIR